MPTATSPNAACLEVERHDHPTATDAAAERAAVRRAAVPAGRRPDAGVRHHELREPGARLAVHAGRLFRGHRLPAYRLLRTGAAGRHRRLRGAGLRAGTRSDLA